MSGVLPENTLPAFKAALEASIDVLEMDVAVTKSHVLVISHDPHINREICLNLDGSSIKSHLLINHLTLSEVKAFDCGSVKHSRFPRLVEFGQKKPKRPGFCLANRMLI